MMMILNGTQKFYPECMNEVQWRNWTEKKTMPSCWRYTRKEMAIIQRRG